MDDSFQDALRDARDDFRSARTTARQSWQDARDEARDVRDDTRNATRDSIDRQAQWRAAQEEFQDTTRDARTEAQDIRSTARDAFHDARREALDDRQALSDPPRTREEALQRRADTTTSAFDMARTRDAASILRSRAAARADTRGSVAADVTEPSATADARLRARTSETTSAGRLTPAEQAAAGIRAGENELSEFYYPNGRFTEGGSPRLQEMPHDPTDPSDPSDPTDPTDGFPEDAAAASRLARIPGVRHEISANAEVELPTGTGLLSDGLQLSDLGLAFDASDLASGSLTLDTIDANGVLGDLGLLQGDVLLSINGQRITTEQGLLTQLFNPQNLDDSITLEVIRDGTFVEFQVTPADLIAELQALPASGTNTTTTTTTTQVPRNDPFNPNPQAPLP